MFPPTLHHLLLTFIVRFQLLGKVEPGKEVLECAVCEPYHGPYTQQQAAIKGGIWNVVIRQSSKEIVNAQLFRRAFVAMKSFGNHTEGGE